MKFYQRVISLFLVLLLPALSLAEEDTLSPDAPGFNFTLITDPGRFSNLITADEALRIAKIRQWGTADVNLASFETITTLVEEDGQPFWITTFVHKEDQDQVRWVKVDAKIGRGVAMDATTASALLDKWQAEKGPFAFWSIQEQALFDTLYLPAACTPRSVFPKQGDLTQQEALALATSLLCQVFNLTEEDVGELTVSYRLSWGDFQITYLNRNEYVWVLHFFKADAPIDASPVYQVHFSAGDGTVYLVCAPGEPGGNG